MTGNTVATKTIEEHSCIARLPTNNLTINTFPD
jgi:hypothetical protein